MGELIKQFIKSQNHKEVYQSLFWLATLLIISFLFI